MKDAAKEKRVELLFEVGCEEIPAGMLPKAEEELRTNIEKLLTAENLFDGVSVETFSAPRRLTAWIRGLLARQADVEIEVTGPPKSVAYDSVGAPTRAAQSFAEKQQPPRQRSLSGSDPQGRIPCRQTDQASGGPRKQILRSVLPRAVHDLTWPRSMTLEPASMVRASFGPFAGSWPCSKGNL